MSGLLSSVGKIFAPVVDGIGRVGSAMTGVGRDGIHRCGRQRLDHRGRRVDTRQHVRQRSRAGRCHGDRLSGDRRRAGQHLQRHHQHAGRRRQFRGLWRGSGGRERAGRGLHARRRARYRADHSGDADGARSERGDRLRGQDLRLPVVGERREPSGRHRQGARESYGEQQAALERDQALYAHQDAQEQRIRDSYHVDPSVFAGNGSAPPDTTQRPTPGQKYDRTRLRYVRGKGVVEVPV
jgi:hypothetical protein